MEISFERCHGVVYCSVSGRVDGETAVAFRDEVLAGVCDGDRTLIMDLSRVPYVSSGGLQSFIIVARQMSRSGVGFALCALGEGVRKIFEVSGFDSVLSVYVDRSEALAGLEV